MESQGTNSVYHVFSQSSVRYLYFFEVKTCPLFAKKKVRVFHVQIWKTDSSNTGNIKPRGHCANAEKNAPFTDKTDFMFSPRSSMYVGPVP